MAIDLPSVSQEWDANATPYLAAMDEMVAAAEAAAAANDRLIGTLAEVQAAIDALHGTDLHIGIDTSAASAAAAAAAVNDLGHAAQGAALDQEALLVILGDLAGAEAADAATARVLAAAQAQGAQSALLLAAAESALRGEQDAAAASSVAGAAATVAAGDAAVRTGGTFTTWLGVLNRVTAAQIPLFGGIMGTVGGLHLLADAAIEVAAVVVPAAIALGAFGVAAAPTIADIVTQMKNLYTVTTATGQAIYPLTGIFQKVAAAVQPEVYTLFGEGLLIISRNTGTFLGLAQGAGAVLDQLGARFTAAVTSGHGFNIFLANAVTDLAKLGDIVGNLGGVLGHVFAAVPGYAQVLLNLADAGSKVLEWAAGVTQPVLAAGLAMHGAWLYAGLGITVLSSAIRGGLTMLGNWGERAAMAAADSTLLGGALSKAAPAMFGFSAGAAEAAALPWGWILAAAAGIGILVYALVSAKDATQQWAASIEQMVAAAPAVNGLTALLVAQTAVATRLAAAQSTLAHTTATVASVNLHTGVTQQATNQAYVDAQRSVAELTGTQQILTDRTALYQYRIGVLGHALGGTSIAMGMVAASGIKMSQFLAYGKTQLAEIEAQVLGTAAAYRAMGQTGGMLGADMNVMNILSSDQYTQITKLNQAWQTWMQTLTGGMSSLAQFETALGSMSQDAAAGSAGLTGAISSIKQGVGGMTYTLQGFGPAAQQSWQQFTSAVNQGNTAIGQMRTYLALGAVSNQTYANTVKAIVGQMIPFTQNNKAALTMLEDLALQAGGPATNSMKALAQWAGVSGNAAKNQAARGFEAATIAAGQLSQVAMHLAATLQTDLTNAVSAAALKASGLQNALNALGTQVQRGATLSSGFHNTLAPVIADMVKLHQDVPSITAYLQGMGVQIDQAQVKAILAGAHLSTMGSNAAKAGGQVAITTGQVKALAAAIAALQSKTIFVRTIFQTSGSQVVGSVGGHTMQHGGVLPGFQPGVDIIPAMLSPGEAILNPYATRALGADWVHAMNTMAERGAVNPAALRMGGSAPGLGAGPADRYGGGDIVVNVDGEQLFKIMMRRGWKYQTSNSGTRTGLSIPGNRVG